MFPYEINPVDKSLQEELMSDFKGERNGYVQVGPKKWFFPAAYTDHAEKFYSYPIRQEDVWVVTYPRSGTIVMEELVWLIVHDLDFDGQARVSLDERFPFFEYTMLHDEEFNRDLWKLNNYEFEPLRKLAFWQKPVYEMDLPSPRLVSTHLPYSLLPPALTKKCKSIYIARNPKDVSVSYYHQNRLLKVFDFQSDFEKYWGYFENDLLTWSPYWEHLKEGWEQRNNPNVLFIFYEDLRKERMEFIKNFQNISTKEQING
ncbi:luciferin sulfotransferase [Halyomorpha halys]|uniref:luciferin sulfotransferase n=1 Tax=Halyomorpha halys TaxID=286706 RepID=UPI0034D1CE81